MKLAIEPEVNALSIEAAGQQVVAPEGVMYKGSRAAGSYLVLRFVDTRIKEEERADGVVEWRAYCDRYYTSEGKEVFREVGEVAEVIRVADAPSVGRLHAWLIRLRVLPPPVK